MKLHILPILFFAALFNGGTSIKGYAQTCDTYYPLTNGSTYELDIYSPKQKKNGRIVNRVQEVKQNGDKLEAQVSNEFYDEKDKKQTGAVYTLLCDGEKVLIDMRSYMSPQALDSYKNFDMKAEGDYLVTPAKLTAGQSLPEGNMTLLLADKKSGDVMTTIKLRIYNRTVEGKESITCPAGTFDCYKINYDMRVETATLGIGIPVNLKATEWVAPGTGVVKSENFRKDGKSMGYTLLSKLSK